MDSAKSIEFRFHMDLQKKLRGVVADVIRGERQFFSYGGADNLKFLLLAFVCTCRQLKNFLLLARVGNLKKISLTRARRVPTIKKKFLLLACVDNLNLLLACHVRRVSAILLACVNN